MAACMTASEEPNTTTLRFMSQRIFDHGASRHVAKNVCTFTNPRTDSEADYKAQVGVH